LIRIVLDTNVIVSALLQPLGPPAQVFRLAIAHAVQLCVSGSVYAEYEEVLTRPRFHLRVEIVNSALQAIRKKSLATPLYVPHGPMELTRFPWWYPWVLPSSAVTFLVCLGFRFLQKIGPALAERFATRF
jgi:putative PIN family toxin of toxin-antitoxin system